MLFQVSSLLQNLIKKLYGIVSGLVLSLLNTLTPPFACSFFSASTRASAQLKSWDLHSDLEAQHLLSSDVLGSSSVSSEVTDSDSENILDPSGIERLGIERLGIKRLGIERSSSTLTNDTVSHRPTFWSMDCATPAASSDAHSRLQLSILESEVGLVGSQFEGSLSLEEPIHTINP